MAQLHIEYLELDILVPRVSNPRTHRLASALVV